MTHEKSVVVPVSAIVGFDVEEYVGGYEFRADEGGYMPTDKERELITDAIHGVMSELSCLSAPAPSSLAGGEVSESAVERAAQALVDYFWDGSQPAFDRKSDKWKEHHVGAVRAVLAALSPEAPAREGVATWAALDENGSAELRVNDQRITSFPSYGGAEEAAKRINAALTPRHEAPAEGVGERDRLARAVYAKRPSWMIHPDNRVLTWEEAADDTPDRVACIYRDVDAVIAALASPPVSERERELEGALRDLLAEIDTLSGDYVGEGIHTGLRKGTDVADAHALWSRIADSETSAWGDACHFFVECFKGQAGKSIKRARALTAQPAGEV